ncbi:hypothetical protein [Niabella ginsengisoli]|uniref:Uncharacterized protein n=1 Tax=Niabella ginsengisoli TaxID=522298 RepID=A0ABS9SKH0_9BACT|nr:hypothetical protein [Niabella ginsengisoli]MCH5598882.1 hypothetical protein [Niabella ginsengisoli]
MKEIKRSLLVLSLMFAFGIFLSKGQTSNAKVTKAHRAGIVLEEFVYTKADFPQCHSATILEIENGELLCAFLVVPASAILMLKSNSAVKKLMAIGLHQ